MKKRYITAIILLALLGLGAAGTWITATDVTVQRYMIWLNSDGRTAATADSVLGFVGGSDTATMIPYMSGDNNWTLTGEELYPDSLDYDVAIGAADALGHELYVNGKTKITGGLYLSGLTYKACDTSLGWSGDSVFKTKVASTSYWTADGSNGIYNNNTGNVGIGTTSPQTKLHIADSTGSLGIIAYMHSSTAGNYPQLNFGKYNGSPSSYAAIVDNTVIGGINFSASHSTSALSPTAAIRVMSTEDWGATEHGSEMLFYTCMTDSSTSDNSMTINGSADLVLKYGDIVIDGGWVGYTPTWTWTGGTAGNPSTVVASYNRVNNKVYYHLDAQGTNGAGTAVTALRVSLPIAPVDNNTYYAGVGYANQSAKSLPDTRIIVLVDAETSLNLYIGGFTIANAANYRIVVDGSYKID